MYRTFFEDSEHLVMLLCYWVSAFHLQGTALLEEFFLDCCTLKMKAMYFFVTSGTSTPATQQHIPQDLNPQLHHNFLPHVQTFLFSINTVVVLEWCNCCSNSLRAGWSGVGTPVGAIFCLPLQTIPVTYLVSCTLGSRFLCWGSSSQGMSLTTHPHLVPRLKKE